MQGSIIGVTRGDSRRLDYINIAHLRTGRANMTLGLEAEQP